MKAIGICGPSGSGKTTLAKQLCEEFNGTLLSLDNYFFPNPPLKKYSHKGQNWELPENIDWEACRRDVENLKKGEPTTVRKMDWDTDMYTQVPITPKDVLFVEGFLLLWDHQLVSLLDLTFYIDISDDIGLKRRMEREKTTENRKWFEEITFPEYKRHREAFERSADVLLNGEDSMESIYRTAEEKVRAILS